MEDICCGLDGAENMGHEGERGEVGLGVGALVGMLLRLLGFNREEGLFCLDSCSPSVLVRLWRGVLPWLPLLLLLLLLQLAVFDWSSATGALATLFLFSLFWECVGVWNRVRGLSQQEGVRFTELPLRDCSKLEPPVGVSLKILSWCSMRISTTMFWNLMSIMAATVSS